MPYCGQENLADYLDFSIGPEAPVKAVVCPFIQGGVGIPPTVLSLFVFGTVGLGLAYRARHPAPILISFMLTGGVAAGTAPAQGVSILAAVFFFGITALGLYLYTRAGRTL